PDPRHRRSHAQRHHARRPDERPRPRHRRRLPLHRPARPQDDRLRRPPAHGHARRAQDRRPGHRPLRRHRRPLTPGKPRLLHPFPTSGGTIMTRQLLTLAALCIGLLPLSALAQVDHLRPADQRGLNVFETPKTPSAEFDGVQVDWGAAFTQQFQALGHSNTAGEILNGDGVNQNELYSLGNGFNLATANLGLDAQLARGVRVNLVTYLSSRHHQEAWVKGGYLQVDDVSWLGVPALDRAFDYLTVKAGHYEINYGDAHFRRTDNGNAIYNPFVGNYLMDAFTTEIGGEVTAQYNGGLAVVGVTGGEIKGDVFASDDPERSRAPAFYGKLGYDRQLNEDLRVRLTGSAYTTSSSASNTLFAGDRAGSRFYYVMENTAASATSNFRSGMVNP